VDGGGDGLQVAGMVTPLMVVKAGAAVLLGATVVLKLLAGAAVADATKRAKAMRDDGVYILMWMSKMRNRIID